MDDDKHTLLVCTVGGSPEPIVATLKRWTPLRVWFVPTRETRPQIESAVIPLAGSEGLALDPGRYDLLELPDGQSFTACVNALRRLTPPVEEWLSRGDQYQVVVDFTGGTKCMSAALALHAHRWRCVFSYVGGRERTKEGVGVVVSGNEQVLHAHNPWDALGFQAVDQATVLFDQGAFASAIFLLKQARDNVGDPARKRELIAFLLLAQAYDAWDRFDHKGALAGLKNLQNSANDVVAVLGRERADRLQAQTSDHRSYLNKLLENSGPTMERVRDLLANALRRGREGRFEDGVARLYRAIEAIAQVRLAEKYAIANTKQVPLASLPEPLATEWASRAEKSGSVFLGLQDAYRLLEALGDGLGLKFRELGLAARDRSPLVSRNNSILAHGFESVGESVFRPLRDTALQLAQVQEADLPFFPSLSGSRQGKC